MSDRRFPVGVLIFLMFVIPAVNGGAGTNTAPWPMFGHDPQHTGRSEYPDKAYAMRTERFEMGSADPYYFSSPSAAIGPDGTVYAGVGIVNGEPRGIIALVYNAGTRQFGNADGNNSEGKWSFNGNAAYVHSSTAIGSDGTIYFGCDDSYVYAITPPSDPADKDGKIKWQFKTGGMVRSSPVIASDGMIYVGSDDGKIYAFHANGTLKWQQPYQTGGMVKSSPAIGLDGTIYVGSEDKYLYAIHPDGFLKWRYKTDGAVVSSPAIGSDGTIYIGSDDHGLHAVHSDGTLRWKYETGGMIGSTPAIGSDGTIYIGSDDTYLHAVNPNGSAKWKFKTDIGVRTPPVITSDGTIIFMSDLGGVTALFPDGSPKWGDGLQSHASHSSPSIGSNGMCIVNGISKLHGFLLGSTIDDGGAIYGIVKDMATDKGAKNVEVWANKFRSYVTRNNTYSEGYYVLFQMDQRILHNLKVSGTGYQTITTPAVGFTPGDPTHYDILLPTTGTLAVTREAIKPASLGQSYQDRVWVAGGTYPYTFSSTTLPSWCTLDASTGSITGTPAAPGSHAFSIKVTDNTGTHDEQEYTMYVMPSGFRGDIDGDRKLAINDVILGLKVLSRKTSLSINRAESGKVSLAGVMYILQSLAGLRAAE
jgi:outer membrane protein assembly factor BamB